MRGSLCTILCVLLLTTGIPSAVLRSSLPHPAATARTPLIFYGRIGGPTGMAQPSTAAMTQRTTADLHTHHSVAALPVARANMRRRTTVAAAVITPMPDAPRQGSSSLMPIVDQPDIRPRHKRIANDVLRAMPPQCMANIANFYVRYDNPQHRGLAGKSTMILSGNLPDDEFRALLIHEFSHTADLGCLTGSPQSGASAFRDGNDIVWNNDPSLLFYHISWMATNVQRDGVKPEDFVSGYASWDPFEDLAESVTYYVLHRTAFRERAASNAALEAKLRWIETYLFPHGINVATSTHHWNGAIPWDTTKLPYQWKTEVAGDRAGADT